MFSKDFFESLNGLTKEYAEEFKIGGFGVQVLVKTRDGDEFAPSRVWKVTDDAVAFCFYHERKAVENMEKLRAYPLVWIPLEEIVSVEFNPGPPGGKGSLLFTSK